MDDRRGELLKNWQHRIIDDLSEIRRIKLKLLALAATHQDTELAAIANELHLARCELANTLTLRFGSELGLGEGFEDCENFGGQNEQAT
jgi:hypothetical protein